MFLVILWYFFGYVQKPLHYYMNHGTTLNTTVILWYWNSYHINTMVLETYHGNALVFDKYHSDTMANTMVTSWYFFKHVKLRHVLLYMKHVFDMYHGTSLITIVLL